MLCRYLDSVAVGVVIHLTWQSLGLGSVSGTLRTHGQIHGVTGLPYHQSFREPDVKELANDLFQS